MRETSGFFIVFLLGLLCFLFLLYAGLNAVEQGIQQLTGLNEENRAFSLSNEEKGLVVTFAGQYYFLPWKCYGRKVRNWTKLLFKIISENLAEGNMLEDF